MTPATDDPRTRYGNLRSEDIAALDRAAQDIGVSTVQLMEIAGWQVARCAWQLLGAHPASVAVVAGRGNNGGDGLVAARHLATWGCDVCMWIVAAEANLSGVVATHAQSAQRNGAKLIVSTDTDELPAFLRGADLVLDGILGTGLRSGPRQPQAAAIDALNAGASPMLAIDVPSGLDATTGEPYPPTVSATATCTLVGVKTGLWIARAVAGELWAADIGMPRAAWQATGLTPPTALTAGALVSVPTGTSAAP